MADPQGSGREGRRAIVDESIVSHRGVRGLEEVAEDNPRPERVPNDVRSQGVQITTDDDALLEAGNEVSFDDCAAGLCEFDADSASVARQSVSADDDADCPAIHQNPLFERESLDYDPRGTREADGWASGVGFQTDIPLSDNRDGATWETGLTKGDGAIILARRNDQCITRREFPDCVLDRAPGGFFMPSGPVASHRSHKERGRLEEGEQTEERNHMQECARGTKTTASHALECLNLSGRGIPSRRRIFSRPGLQLSRCGRIVSGLPDE